MRCLITFLMIAVVLFPAPLRVDCSNSPGGRAVQVTSLSPNEFPELALGIRQYLLRNRYLIPQVEEITRRHNVISGRFRHRDKHDVAVLCSRNGFSEILIFWGGSPRMRSSIARKGDDPMRYITAVGSKYILDHARSYGGPHPPRVLDRDGIEDGWAGKGSMIWYLQRGRWRELQGAD